MGIQYDTQQTQEDVKQSLSEQQTIAQPPGPPLQPPPHPPSRPPHGRRERWLIAALVVVLVLIVALGSVFAVQVLTRPGTRPTPVPTVAATPTPVPTRAPTPVPSAGAYQPINALWMSTATTGRACTTTRRIVRTTDGGKHWQDVTPYPASYQGSISPVFTSLNQQVAWVALFENQQPDGTLPNVVFRTSNGGQSWQESTLPAGSLGVSHMQFLNARDGWLLAGFGGQAMGSQGMDLYRSTGGGQTWRLVAWAGSPSGTIPLGGVKSGMSWLSPTTGWITGAVNAAQNFVYLYRTQDSGATWQQQSLALPSGQALVTTYPPVFFSATDGLLPVTFTSQGVSLIVYATHDGGATWSGSTLLSNPGTSCNEDLLSMQQGWVVTADGSTLDTTRDQRELPEHFPGRCCLGAGGPGYQPGESVCPAPAPDHGWRPDLGTGLSWPAGRLLESRSQSERRDR